jgi:imidazolonepropionase-like amidohydrolase
VTTVTGVVAPRIIGAGALLDSQRFLTHVERVDRMVAARGVQPLAFDPPVQRVSVSAAAQVRSAVDRVLALEGVFVKVRTYESPEVFFAIAREAKRRGLSFAGHSPPEGVSWTEAVSAGMTSIEHMGGSYAAQLGQLSPAERHSVYQGLIRGGAFVDPNVLCEIIRAMPDTQARALVHASAAGLMTYNPWNTPQLKDVFRRELAIRLLEKQIAPAPDWASTSRQEFTLLKELSSNGVPVLAGTDLGSLLIYPGFSLHDELQGLVDQVGLMPVEALRAATVAPAQFFKAANWGRIANGQRADLVLLEGNPLDDIRMTRRIRSVVLDGKYYDRSTLDTLLRFGANR